MKNELLSLLKTFEAFVTPEINQDEKKKKGEYSYIALSMEDFAKQVQVVSGCLPPRHYPGRYVFVDVGCGIGTKLLASRYFGKSWDLVGIEITSEYANVARKLLSSEKCEIREQDALTVDYSSFDVIYFYCPLSDYKKQQKLEKRIIETAKPGAYVLANLKQLDEDEVWQKPPMRRVWGNVIYQKMED